LGELICLLLLSNKGFAVAEVENPGAAARGVSIRHDALDGSCVAGQAQSFSIFPLRESNGSKLAGSG
jgi:hypothetical protein